MKKFTLAALVATVAVITTVSPVFANDTVAEQAQKQKFEQEFDVVCEHGAYGQSDTCHVSGKQSGEQEQRQRILAAQIGGRKIHVPVDTAINTTTVAIMLAAAFLGLGSSVALTKVV